MSFVNKMIGLMAAIIVIVMLIAFAPTLQLNANEQTASMDCTNTTITDWDKASCLFVDISPGFYLGFMVAIIGIIITARYFI